MQGEKQQMKHSMKSEERLSYWSQASLGFTKTGWGMRRTDERWQKGVCRCAAVASTRLVVDVTGLKKG